jgi:hypothetical protein
MLRPPKRDRIFFWALTLNAADPSQYHSPVSHNTPSVNTLGPRPGSEIRELRQKLLPVPVKDTFVKL